MEPLHVLGRSITHGCIRLGDEDLELVYKTCPLGTMVYIYFDGRLFTRVSSEWFDAGRRRSRLVPGPTRLSILFIRGVEAGPGTKFYFVFDPQVPELQLRLAGVVLRKFALKSSSIGQPRLQGGGDAVWPAVQFTLANELPGV